MIMSEVKKGGIIRIDRFNNGEVEAFTVQRICKKHINVKNEKGSWAMPNNRIRDIK